MGFDISGSFDQTLTFLRKMTNREAYQQLDRLGQEGVEALSAFTPVDEGVTASSWYYEIHDGPDFKISWHNSHMEEGFSVAVGLQMGHGTGGGGYVVGRDYINPALRPVFDKISDQVWRAVTNS